MDTPKIVLDNIARADRATRMKKMDDDLERIHRFLKLLLEEVEKTKENEILVISFSGPTSSGSLTARREK